MSNRSPGTVLHIIDTGGPGGAETMFAELAARLDSPSLKSVAAVSREGWLAERLRERGLEPQIVASSGSFDIAYIRKLLRLARQHNARLIHAHLLGATVYAAIVGLILRIPVIGVFHGPSDLTGSQSLRAVKRWLMARGCAHIVAVSMSTFDAVSAYGIRKESVTLIPNGIDTSRFAPSRQSMLREELGLRSDDLLVGSLGNIRKPKDYPNLIRSAHVAAQLEPRAHFAVVGEGDDASLAELQELRDSLGLSERVHFLGFRPVTPELLGSFDLFVSSSSSEGLPLSFLEAMASGLCVVATASGGAQEVIDNERTGLLVPTRDSEALGQAIARALGEPAFAASLAKAGRQRVLEEFSLDAAVARYKELYEQSLGSSIA